MRGTGQERVPQQPGRPKHHTLPHGGNKKTFFEIKNVGSSAKVGEEGICAGKNSQWVSKCSKFGFMFYNLLTCAVCLKVSLENP